MNCCPKFIDFPRRDVKPDEGKTDVAENASETPAKPAENGEKPAASDSAPARKRKDDVTTLTGGAYIPPAKLRMMQEKITDKST